jgi:hypothetical protein
MCAGKSWFEATVKPLKPERMSALPSAENGSYDNHIMNAGFLRLTLGAFWPERGNSSFHDPM